MVPIVSRAQWGAAFTIPGGRHVAPSQRRWFVVHWPGSAVGGDERAVVRAIERHHRQAQGWQAAPGYNFLVGRSGTIYEGCGRDVRGIHSPPRNIDGWGVCVLISVGENPPQAALNATRALYNWLNGVAGRTLGMTWHGQHWATVCAGPNLNAWVQAGMPVGVPAPPPPLPPPLKEDSVIIHSASAVYLLNGGRLHHIVDPESLEVYRTMGLPETPRPITPAEEAALLADFPVGNPAVTVNTTGPSYAITGTAIPQ
jgi:hypothetical protein